MITIPARKPATATPERKPLRVAPHHVADDLGDDLERGACGGAEEEDREHVVREEAARPGAEDRRAARDHRQGSKPCERRRRSLLGRRRRDPETLGDVVDHEADDQERAERQLTEGEGGADREPLAEVVDADPDRDERRERDPAESAAAAREPRREERHRQVAERDAEQDEAGAAERARNRRLELEGLEERLDAEEREQAGGQGHEPGQPALVDPPQRRQPEQAERDRQHADEEADDRVAEGAAGGEARRLDRGGDLLDGLDPGRAGDADRDRIVLDPAVGDHDRARAQPAERLRAVELERDDRVVDRHGRDREVVLLRVRDADLDLAGLELHPADVELVRLGRVRADQADEGRARGDEGAHRQRQEHDRQQRPEAPAGLDPPRRRPRFHQSTTLKKPIQPRSVNSDWCAWNMNRPVFEKSISSTPRCPWHCITVSVYSQLSPVPVGW